MYINVLPWKLGGYSKDALVIRLNKNSLPPWNLTEQFYGKDRSEDPVGLGQLVACLSLHLGVGRLDSWGWHILSLVFSYR